MATKASSPAAASPRLPDGVAIQPRRFEFRNLETVPQYWLADNPIASHAENAFSLFIPPGERFFIRSVQRYADRVADPELRELICAFSRQEALHTRAHEEFNASLERFGVDVRRERERAERAMAGLARYLPARMQLAATAFLEHVTATGAHFLFAEPAIASAMHPEMLRFWRWHAAEEIEHKAVAFDVYREIGGGYLLRVASALAAVLLLAGPFVACVRRMLRDDPTPITGEMRTQARALHRKAMQPQLRMLAAYFFPGFHPWRLRDEPYLTEWYAAPDAVPERPPAA